jgi:hypothetical protein
MSARRWDTGPIRKALEIKTERVVTIPYPHSVYGYSLECGHLVECDSPYRTHIQCHQCDLGPIPVADTLPCPPPDNTGPGDETPLALVDQYDDAKEMSK